MCIDIVEIRFEIANGQMLPIFDRYLPAIHLCFLFPDNNLSKCQWICTKFGMRIDIIEIWFWIVHGQILSISTELSALHMSVFCFQAIKSKYQWTSTFTKPDMFIYIVIWFGITNG